MRAISRQVMLPALAVLAAPTLLSNPAFAQVRTADIHAGVLEVAVNKSQVVTVDRPILKALIGSSEIADVLPLSERSVYVLGKKPGTTSLTIYDASNRVVAVMDVAVGPDVEGLKRQFATLVPGQPIEARISNDSIILSGMVNDAGAADRAVQIARSYVDNPAKVINLVTMGASQQVMLEVRFAEVSRQVGEKLGVSGFGLSNNGSFDAAVGSGASLVPGTNGTGVMRLGAITDAFGVLRKSFSIGNVDVEGVLNALEKRGLAKTLAEPTLVALSGEKASFLAGGEFPVPVAQGGGNTGTGATAITVEFKPFGVSLGFTPTVLGDKVINLLVEPEVSSIDPTASLTINNLTIPGLQTRRASTTVELRDGESFAIAGLLRRDFQTTVNQLPILGSLPIIGALFRSSSFQKGETELLIVITPHLVAPLRPEQVRLPTDRIADPKAIDVLIDGEGYRPVPLAPQPKADPAAPPKVGSAEPVPAPAPAQELAATTAAAASPATPSAKEKGYAY